MRKTSQDGGDSTSITSGIENEIKKPGGILKTKRTSIKRKVQSLSHESDDAVIEPLLQKEKTGSSNQSAKYDFLSKSKTDTTSETKNDKEKLLQDGKMQTSALSDSRNVTEAKISMPSSNLLPKFTSTTAPLHNHMNTNVFSSHDAAKGLSVPKSQILVEIDGSKQTGYNASPLIFTTAKIHTDGKTKHMEPLQVTPVPILSTIEVSIPKGTGNNNSGEISRLVTSDMSSMYANVPKNNTNSSEKDQKLKSILPTDMTIPSSRIVDNKALNSSDKHPILDNASTKERNTLDTTSTKDLNRTESKLAANNLKNSFVAGSRSINDETTKDRDEKQTKMSLSQPTNGTSLEAIKTNASTDTCKPTISSVNTPVSSVSYSNEDNPSRTLEQMTKIDKIDVTKSNKTAMNAMPTSAKQLQRQKIAIDKDDNIKLESNVDSSSMSNEPKHVNKIDKIEASLPKSTTQVKSPSDDVNRLNDKTKLPKSAANNIHIITTSTKPPSVNATVTLNKSNTSNMTTSVKPIMISSNTTPPISNMPITKVTEVAINTTSTISSKPSRSTVPGMVATDVSAVETPASNPNLSAKVTAINSTLKDTVTKTAPQAMVSKSTVSGTKGSSISTSSAKSAPLSTSTVKSTSASTGASKASALKSTTASAPLPAINLKTQPVTAGITKSEHVTTTTAKSTASIVKAPSGTMSSAKTPSVSTSSAKTPSVSTSSAKAPSASSSTVKASSISTSVGKTPSASTNSAKAPSISTSSAKTPTISTSSAKTPSVPISSAKTPPVSTTSTKTPSVSTSTVKAPSISTSVTKTSSVSTNDAKTSSVLANSAITTPVSTSAAKTSSTSTSTVKSSGAKNNKTPINKNIDTSPALSSQTAIKTATVGSTSTPTSAESNKKNEDKSVHSQNSKNLKA